MPELDIHASAREVADLFNCNQTRQAVERLNTLREGQSLVVQEALDRFIAVDTREQLTALAAPGAIAAGDAAQVSPVLERLRGATGAPRFPDVSETGSLSQAQLHDVYGSIVATRGNDAARDSLEANGERVILGLRNETETTVRDGFGAYDDRVVLVWKDNQGARHAREFNEANTEPGAQYDHHAGSDGTRRFKDDRGIAPRLAASPGYEEVQRRDIEGTDVNRDGIRDLGRLADGTTEMRATTHPTYTRGRVTGSEFALRPTPEAVANGAGRVQRDTNGDGWFNAADINGVQDLNETFKAHRGGSRNPDSAGCMTIRNSDYDGFAAEVQRNPQQNRWQYVLTSVDPRQLLQQGRGIPEEGQPAPQPARGGVPGGAGVPRHPAEPGHPDHAMHQQVQDRLGALGKGFTENNEHLAVSLVAEAKSHGLSRVDHLFHNQATATMKAGENLFLVQGAPGDHAATRALVHIETATRTPLEESLARIEHLNHIAAMTPAIDPQRSIDQNAPGIRLGSV